MTNRTTGSEREPRHQCSPQLYDQTEIVSWVHFGDLHLTTASEQNHQDFLALIHEANIHLVNGVNFAVLPGDNADDGAEEQYEIVRQAIDQLQIPLYAIPGDHDFKSGDLNLFQRYLEQNLWQSFALDSYKFVFLNSMEFHGGHGFDFSKQQVEWLRGELEAATGEELRAVLFMHTYPSELAGGSRRVQELIRMHRVLLVEMGHTHYNELANDGHTLYAATRSTGQIEEGPVGFSITNLDGGGVSWKFKPLGQWPFVMITSPVDHRLLTGPDQLVRGAIEIRAKGWGLEGAVSAVVQVDDRPPMDMSLAKSSSVWACAWDSTTAANGEHRLVVRMRDAAGNSDEDSIDVLVAQDGLYEPTAYAEGDAENAIGAYHAKGILGTQLGPNKNGRKW